MEGNNGGGWRDGEGWQKDLRRAARPNLADGLACSRPKVRPRPLERKEVVEASSHAHPENAVNAHHGRPCGLQARCLISTLWPFFWSFEEGYAKVPVQSPGGAHGRGMVGGGTHAYHLVAQGNGPQKGIGQEEVQDVSGPSHVCHYTQFNRFAVKLNRLYFRGFPLAHSKMAKAPTPRIRTRAIPIIKSQAGPSEVWGEVGPLILANGFWDIFFCSLFLAGAS